MPPPRRFSAAPTLVCPHRNKHSSSHSSSSLQHTYSIDSSESMITVIPARGCQEERHSRGSLSCNSGQGGAFSDLSGSLYALPRSPMSPRSPGRCSPGLLTPNTPGDLPGLGQGRSSEGNFALANSSSSVEPPLSPGATNSFTSSTSNLNTVIQHQPHHNQQQLSSSLTQQDGARIKVQSSLSNGSCYNLTLPISELSVGNNMIGNFDELDQSSLVVENGTSYNGSSRNEPADLEEEEEDVQQQTDPFECDINLANKEAFGEEIRDHFGEYNGAEFDDNNTHNLNYSRDNTIDLDAPIIRETINEFCARHSREELEFLVNQISYLKIRDCYFSKSSSTLCIIIEVQEN